MKKLGLLLILMFLGTAYAGQSIPGYRSVVEGEITFRFQPLQTGARAGSWQPIVISPSGKRFVGPEVSCSTMKAIEMSVQMPGNYVETGSYSVVLKNNIDSPSLAHFVDVITVESTVQGQDRYTIREIPGSVNGENTVVIVRVLEDPALKIEERQDR